MLNWNRSRSFKYSGHTLSVYETQEIDVNYSLTNFIIVELYDDGSAKIAIQIFTITTIPSGCVKKISSAMFTKHLWEDRRMKL